MALGFREGSGAELHGKESGNVAPEENRAVYRYASSESFAYEGTPPAAQQMMMDRQPVVLGADGEHDEGRIPASVFERDASDPGKDWSMMSTDSVFGLQVAPSCDFTGYFLAHPELMDITTPPRDSSAGAATPTAASTPRHFESIPELGDAAPSYSFAFPKLMEDKGYSSKKNQQSREQPLTPKATPTEPRTTTDTAQPEAETSSKPEAAPQQEAAKGGMFSWMPCCS
ncbi:uncharacterized protein [Lolium perenne]|uniref:uncharacterized protein n=1 Tax=Lolium perenne TaxID=4522 RepID=UPI0021EAA4FA|nr:uncharacterized protein LOC127311266 [Lolium perenne]